MSLNDLVSVAISSSTVTPTQQGFGTPLLAAYHKQNTDRVRFYSSLAGAVGDGFTPTGPTSVIWRELSVAFAQNPAPTLVGLGRRALVMTQTLALLLSSISATDTYIWSMVGWDGTVHKFSFASTGVAATDATTMAGLINAATVSPVVAGGVTPPVVTLTGTPTANSQIVIQITTAGVGTAAVFKWSLNGGTSFTTGVSVAATVALTGTGLTANFAVSAPDTYALSNVYTANTTLGFATVNTATVTVTQTPGFLVDIQGWNPTGVTTPIIALTDNTTDPGIATDLAAIQATAAPGSFYGVALDSNSSAEITAAAAWAESAGLDLFLFNSSDTACITTATTDVFSSQKALTHARSGGLYSGSSVLSASGLAWLAKTLPSVPGSLTFMYKSLASVPADNLSETAQLNLTAKNANFFVPVAGVNITVNGWDAAGEFLDQVWGTDALVTTIQTNVFAYLAGLPKVSYTDLGVAGILSVVQAALNLFADKQHNFLATNPAPAATAPLVATLSSTQRASRIFPSITFSGKYAGAIHALAISGTLTT